jgi:hypothetical protein
MDQFERGRFGSFVQNDACDLFYFTGICEVLNGVDVGDDGREVIVREGEVRVLSYGKEVA